MGDVSLLGPWRRLGWADATLYHRGQVTSGLTGSLHRVVCQQPGLGKIDQVYNILDLDIENIEKQTNKSINKSIN